MSKQQESSHNTAILISKVLVDQLQNYFVDFVTSFLLNLFSTRITAIQRLEASLHQRHTWMTKGFNRYTYNLRSLQMGGTVAIQNQLNRRWNIIGEVITVLPDLQYRIRVDGSGWITLRNHQFFEEGRVSTRVHPQSALPMPIGSANDVPVTHYDSPISTSYHSHAAVEHPHDRHLHIIMSSIHTMHAIKNSSDSVQTIPA